MPPFHELIVSNGKLVEFVDDLGEINISEKLKTVSPDETKNSYILCFGQPVLFSKIKADQSVLMRMGKIL